MNRLGYHILARLHDRCDGVDQKGRFGKYENLSSDFTRSQDVPQLVRDNLPTVVRREFALDPPAVEADQAPITHNEYRDFWLEQVQGQWDIYDIAESMADRFDINPGWAYKQSRQHLNQLVLQARMRGYREDEPLAGRKFRWAGPDPEHPACQWIMEQQDDDGQPFHEIVELMQKAKRRFVEDPPPSTHVVHDWCRHELREVQD